MSPINVDGGGVLQNSEVLLVRLGVPRRGRVVVPGSVIFDAHKIGHGLVVLSQMGLVGLPVADRQRVAGVAQYVVGVC